MPPRTVGLVAVAVLAYALCDLLHEGAHATATLLPLDVQTLSISTVAVSTSRSSPLVAAAGVTANLILALMLFASASASRSPAARYFWWLFGCINLFNAAGYLLYSGLLGSGDLAVVFNAVARPGVWRPVSILLGVACYAAAVQASLWGLRKLVDSGVVPVEQIERYCMVPYWTGAVLLTAGAALNPTSPWLVLTSGAAVGFGAMIGLVILPRLVGSREPAARSSHPPDFGGPWLVAGAVAAIVFVGVFGPGVRLGP